MKHRVANSPISLFSFQDIITGLCGIVIFFVMVMLADFAGRHTEEKDKIPNLAETKDLEISAVKNEISLLEEELSKVRAKARNVVMASSKKNAPDVERRLIAEMDEKERSAAALLSQIADLRTRVESARRADAECRRRVKEMEETRRLLERRLAAMKGQKGITLIPERGMFKIPVYLVCGKNGVELLKPTEQDPVRGSCSVDGIQEFLDRELVEMDHTTHTIILLVRPSGVPLMDRVAEIVKGYGLEYGRDPLEEDVVVSIGKPESRP